MNDKIRYVLALCLIALCSACSLDAGPQLESQAAAEAKTYYVSGTGSDSNTGRMDAPFRTLQHAADLTQPGDTVWVMNGTYTKAGPDTDVLEIRRSGREDAYIQYKAYAGQSPRIKVDNNFAGIQISAAYITVEGFTVEGNSPNLSASKAKDLALLPASRKSEALDNTLYNSNGIFALPLDNQNPHHLNIRKNHVFNCPGSGIAANGADYVRIENNLVHNNSYYSPYATSGISFYQPRSVDSSSATKMYIRGNTVYQNENKVPFWFSDEANPSKRTITDGNGVIVDDTRNTQGIVSEAGSPYKGAIDVSNNLSYDNGGRGVNVFSSDNVVVRYNTTYKNARAVSSAITSELVVGDASKVEVSGNIIVARSDRKVVDTYNTSAVSFANNLFYGGNGSNVPGGSGTNLVKNGTFNADLSNWSLSKSANAGYVQNTRDSYGRNCVYVDGGNLQNTYDVYLFQKGLTLKQGVTYTVSLDAITSAGKTASFTVKLGGSSGSSTPYTAQKATLSGDKTQRKTFSFKMNSPTDDNTQLELQVGKNAAASYLCFDNIVVAEASSNTADPQFVNPSTDPASANFRLESSSPARDAGTSAAPPTDIENVTRPKGPAADIGAYESF